MQGVDQPDCNSAVFSRLLFALCLYPTLWTLYVPEKLKSFCCCQAIFVPSLDQYIGFPLDLSS